MANVSSEEVAVYRPLCERLASRFVKRDYRIEHDDLVQVGWIRAWELLEIGVKPTAPLILNAMKNWATYVTKGVSSEATLSG